MTERDVSGGELLEQFADAGFAEPGEDAFGSLGFAERGEQFRCRRFVALDSSTRNSAMRSFRSEQRAQVFWR
ncbi:hypothetical protein G205_23217 [Arthrobacter nitrophenolicus]|uniref:Uncharacterized protein n=1 Tax=Arthrobacter nitrophenolicus TaxID=683150 RepID=L8TH18_9MICC|nr:hypothetical protein G205_23217 [Arthrobacter nitrophenolicus]